MGIKKRRRQYAGEVRTRQQVCHSVFVHVRHSCYLFKTPLSPPHPNVRPLANLSYLWPDDRNGVFGRKGSKGEGWDVVDGKGYGELT